MNLSQMTAALLTASEMTLADKAISSAKVILTGFVVVFAVLLLLIGIIILYSKIVDKIQSAGSNKKKKSKEKAVPSTQATDRTHSSVQALPTVPEIQDGIPEEVIAVIAAAVSATYGSSGKVGIKSIKKSGGGRSAWANAGVLENTRPF